MSYEQLEPLRTADEVTEEVLKHAEEVYDTYFASEERIDWEDFIDHMARISPRYDFNEYDNPAIRKIQRHIRRIRNEYQ